MARAARPLRLDAGPRTRRLNTPGYPPPAVIVDLRVAGRTAVVVGGGSEALKRTEALLAGGCRVHVAAAADHTGGRLSEMAASGAIALDATGRISSAAAIIKERSPFVVVAATDDAALNARILSEARRAGCLAYASDDPEGSDFANLSAIDIGAPGEKAGRISVAVSTGGASPAMARELRARIEPLVRSAVTPADQGMVALHARLRPLIAERMAGSPQPARRAALARISEDPALKQLLGDGEAGGAWRRAEGMLGEICNEAGPGQR